MKQVAQNYKTGELALLDVAPPTCRPGGVLVRTEYSLISSGTEKMKVEESKLSLLGKARARPDQVRKVLDSISQQGLLPTYRKAMNRLDSFTPLGYSAVGVVTEVGEGVDDLRVGQRVACGGNLYAHHAEVNWVPRNLCVPVPDSVEPEHAAFTVVGSIALQGFRQSDARLGEVACVIGLGLIGQLLVQVLRSAGVHVVGVDVSEDRCLLAEKNGAAATAGADAPAADALVGEVMRLTDGAGADHVFLTASTESREPVFLAARLARDRARIVDIGKCNLDLPWDQYYEKELDVRFSRSYGPGRYDPVYEEQGVDYPIGYVRWTERRNMKAFLDLVADRRCDIGSLIAEIYPFDDAVEVYESLHKDEVEGIGILFRYPDAAPPDRVVVEDRRLSDETASVDRAVVRLGVIGSGNYATSMLLPHLEHRSDVDLVEVATATPLSGATAKRRFGFGEATTDYRRTLENDAVDAVLIATRHDTHAGIVAEALRAGKAVFVEKPLAVSEEGLSEVLEAMEDSGNDKLMVGFNRRFAPLLCEMREAWGKRRESAVLHYVVNAGSLDRGSWYAQTDSHGTRFVGEGCHFVDTVSWWVGDDPVEVFATRAGGDPDTLECTLFYPDGSTAMISYLTAGSARRYPKETLTVFGDGAVARLDNFSRFEIWEGRRHRVRRSLRGIDKGQKGELEAFVASVRQGAPMPIAAKSLVKTTEATLAAHRSAAARCVVPVGPVRDPAAGTA